MKIPECIKSQLKSKKFFFDYNGDEWKLEIEEDSSFLKGKISGDYLVFANNGYGDYLFIKKGSPKIYEFFHETAEIFEVEESLEELIGVKEKPPIL